MKKAHDIAEAITGELGGYGLFGVELFIKGDEVIFSEVSPRPHDTGMVTLISQDLSEFALHVRAILGLPVSQIEQYGPSASAVVLVEGSSTQPAYKGFKQALNLSGVQLRLFGKPGLDGRRRLGVALARGETISEARQKACKLADSVKVEL